MKKILSYSIVAITSIALGYVGGRVVHDHRSDCIWARIHWLSVKNALSQDARVLHRLNSGERDAALKLLKFQIDSGISDLRFKEVKYGITDKETELIQEAEAILKREQAE